MQIFVVCFRTLHNNKVFFSNMYLIFYFRAVKDVLSWQFNYRVSTVNLDYYSLNGIVHFEEKNFRMKISAKIKTKITKCLNLKSLKSDLKLKIIVKICSQSQNSMVDRN